jgi:hypothetical protein
MSRSRYPLLLAALALTALAYHEGPAAPAESQVPPAEFVAPALPAVAVSPWPEPAADESYAADTTFAQLIQHLSEPGGYFDSDNLISNEASYLHVLGKLQRMGVTGGAFIGVGPDQSFSYIARIRPNIAFMIDIRRDNLLHHFLLKSLFARANNRLEYLCLLFGRPAPRELARWNDRDIDALLAYIDGTPADPAAFERTLKDVAAVTKGFGYPLSDTDYATIRRFHRAFFEAGLDLQFTSHGRSPRWYYPTFRQLLLETDLEGRRGSFLVDEDDFQFLKRLQAKDLIIPVVGDLAGHHALAGIGALLRERGETVSAFYTSNVEFYLMAGGSFDEFARNVERLPRNAKSVIIRSYFGRGYPHPQAVPGYNSTQLLQTLDSFVADERAGGYRSYVDLVVGNLLDLRS